MTPVKTSGLLISVDEAEHLLHAARLGLSMWPQHVGAVALRRKVNDVTDSLAAAVDAMRPDVPVARQPKQTRPRVVDPDDGWLTASQVADRLGYTSRYVRLLCERGALVGARRSDRGWLIPEGTCNR